MLNIVCNRVNSFGNRSRRDFIESKQQAKHCGKTLSSYCHYYWHQKTINGDRRADAIHELFVAVNDEGGASRFKQPLQRAHGQQWRSP